MVTDNIAEFLMEIIAFELDFGHILVLLVEDKGPGMPLGGFVIVVVGIGTGSTFFGPDVLGLKV